MKAEKDVDLLAGESPYIFGGEIRPEAKAEKEESGEGAETAAVTVDEVIRVPAGLTGLSGKVVRVRLLRPLSPGRYIFFAEPWAVGKELTVSGARACRSVLAVARAGERSRAGQL
jgi:hypothetical protein